MHVCVCLCVRDRERESVCDCDCVCVCMCVCVCVRDRERESVCVWLWLCMRMHVCVRQRQRDRERERERERERACDYDCFVISIVLFDSIFVDPFINPASSSPPPLLPPFHVSFSTLNSGPLVPPYLPPALPPSLPPSLSLPFDRPLVLVLFVGGWRCRISRAGLRFKSRFIPLSAELKSTARIYMRGLNYRLITKQFVLMCISPTVNKCSFFNAILWDLFEIVIPHRDKVIIPTVLLYMNPLMQHVRGLPYRRN